MGTKKMAKVFTCQLCGKEYESCAKKTYYCLECEAVMRNVKKMRMIDKAEKTLKKKQLIGNRYFAHDNVDEYIKIVRDRMMDGVDNLQSKPEVEVAVQLQRIHLGYEAQKDIGGCTVDFYIPKIHAVLEIDGSLYHADEDKVFLRDRRIMSYLGERWDIIHISSEMVPNYTWNLAEAIPYILLKRKDAHSFRDPSADSLYIEEFAFFEEYMLKNGRR